LRNLILYGGTFDPIHLGHLHTAINVQNHFNFQQFIFLPCKISVLKNNAHASPEQRVKMMSLAIAEYKNTYPFEIDTREIKRDSPSYMVTTLTDFRKESSDLLSITLLMGIDTFAQLPKWHQWQKLLSLANIIVIDRPFHSTTLTNELQELVNKHETTLSDQILHHSHGLIYRFNAGLYDFSSTKVREELFSQQQSDALPGVLVKYIKQHNLYK